MVCVFHPATTLATGTLEAANAALSGFAGHHETSPDFTQVPGSNEQRLSGRTNQSLSSHTRLASASIAAPKIKGGNIVPKPLAGPPGLWAEWDWTNWIKPQVDRAMALGLNAIRIIGAPQVVLARINPDLPAIPLATYIARWEQLATYCQENGLRLYPSLTEKWAYMYTQFGGLGGVPPWNFRDPAVTSVITASAAALAKYPNVIGFDIFQEGGGSHSDGLTVDDVLALYAAIRRVAPNVPLTTSDSSGSYPTAEAFWQDTESLSYQLWVHPDGADFVDVHIYLEGVDPTQIDSLIQRTKLPVLIGEYGGGQDIPAHARIARYESAQRLHNRVDILGSFVWALADQGTTDDKRFGVFDNTGFSQPSYPSTDGETPLSTTSGQRPELVDALSHFGD